MGALPGRPRVAVVFRYIHHYRLRFYELLRTELDRRGIELVLVSGQPGPHELSKDDAVEVLWATKIHNRYLKLGAKDLCWQPCLTAIRDADLVVVEQASRLLVTYVLLAWRRFGGPRVAFWGHGRNIRPHLASGFGERIKASITGRADWFFAYNEASAQVLRQQGLRDDRTTVVQNAVDTTALAATAEAVTQEQARIMRRRLGIEGEDVGVFVGALYEEKRLPFLVAAGDIVHRRLPGFELVVIGTGPEEAALRHATAGRPWLHVAGALYGEAKVHAMLAARLLLLPGLVGLAILDGFALGLPLVTARVPFHSDEIAYMEDGVHGVMVDDWRDPEAYAHAVVDLLTDPTRLDRMRFACREAAAKYTVETMAVNFADGVEAALGVTGAR